MSVDAMIGSSSSHPRPQVSSTSFRMVAAGMVEEHFADNIEATVAADVLWYRRSGRLLAVMPDHVDLNDEEWTVRQGALNEVWKGSSMDPPIIGWEMPMQGTGLSTALKKMSHRKNKRKGVGKDDGLIQDGGTGNNMKESTGNKDQDEQDEEEELDQSKRYYVDPLSTIGLQVPNGNIANIIVRAPVAALPQMDLSPLKDVAKPRKAFYLGHAFVKQILQQRHHAILYGNLELDKVFSRNFGLRFGVGEDWSGIVCVKDKEVVLVFVPSIQIESAATTRFEDLLTTRRLPLAIECDDVVWQRIGTETGQFNSADLEKVLPSRIVVLNWRNDAGQAHTIGLVLASGAVKFLSDLYQKFDVTLVTDRPERLAQSLLDELQTRSWAQLGFKRASASSPSRISSTSPNYTPTSASPVYTPTVTPDTSPQDVDVFREDVDVEMRRVSSPRYIPISPVLPMPADPESTPKSSTGSDSSQVSYDMSVTVTPPNLKPNPPRKHLKVYCSRVEKKNGQCLSTHNVEPWDPSVSKEFIHPVIVDKSAVAWGPEDEGCIMRIYKSRQDPIWDVDLKQCTKSLIGIHSQYFEKLDDWNMAQRSGAMPRFREVMADVINKDYAILAAAKAQRTSLPLPADGVQFSVSDQPRQHHSTAAPQRPTSSDTPPQPRNPLPHHTGYPLPPPPVPSTSQPPSRPKPFRSPPEDRPRQQRLRTDGYLASDQTATPTSFNNAHPRNMGGDWRVRVGRDEIGGWKSEQNFGRGWDAQAGSSYPRAGFGGAPERDGFVGSRSIVDRRDSNTQDRDLGGGLVDSGIGPTPGSGAGGTMVVEGGIIDARMNPDRQRLVLGYQQGSRGRGRGGEFRGKGRGFGGRGRGAGGRGWREGRGGY